VTGRRLGLVQVAAVLVAVLFVGLQVGRLVLRPAPGTLLVMAAGRSVTDLAGGALEIHDAAGWHRLAELRQTIVPAAPDTATLVRAEVPSGAYDRLRAGGSNEPAAIHVDRGKVEPVLVGVDRGRILAGGVYAGTDGYNLGLTELAGRLVPLPPFDLVDQAGHRLDNAALQGHPALIAAFNTKCHETCPLYAGLFMELRQRLPAGVRLLEVTTEPAADTVDQLDTYARATGADWTLATGDAAKVAAFWQPFGVTLGTGDGHVSTLALVDAHGYIRLVYRGAPDLSQPLPRGLYVQLDEAGRKQSAAGGDFDSAQILDAVAQVGKSSARQSGAGGLAPDFSLPALDGGHVTLEQFRGRPLVVSFFASWCPPCRTDLPLLQRTADGNRGVAVVLVDWHDDAGAAHRLAEQLGLRVPVAVDSDGGTGAAYGVAGLPTTVFVRGDGTIESRYAGELSERVLAAHVAELAGG
jgi:cytochrome oxidase Cu insertion factor (SCO1/SenC/PrrC family)